MKTIHIKQVDAFTAKPFSGNPAGVVLDADGLTDAEMQTIARELNNPETAFILKPGVKDANLQIRWFTPTEEVPLCGHATIASFHALAESGLEGMKCNGQHYFRLQTKSGVLAVRVEKNFHGISIEFELPDPVFKIKKKISPKLFTALSLKPSDLESRLPIVANSYLYLPVKQLSTLLRLQPDYKLLAKQSRTAKYFGICVFTVETKEKKSAVHSRFFAPANGIDEDPVTGSANGPLGVYLHRYAVPAGFSVAQKEMSDGRIEYIGEQGDVLERPGRVRIRLHLKNGEVEDVSISGEAVTVFETTIPLK
jgi:PhzF family phenazine biosynthesis protein